MSSMQDYLKRYTEGVGEAKDEKRKKKRKKGAVAVKKVQGIVIHDEDAQWQKQIEEPKDEDEGEVDEAPKVEADADTRMKLRLDKLRAQQEANGSAWLEVGTAEALAREARVSPDISPPRKTRSNSSPPRKARHDSPDLSHPQKGGRHDSPDLSPPQKVKSETPDLSPPRKARHDSPDLSPPRRTRQDSPRRKSRHDPPDLSPPRKLRPQSPDLSPPRKARHDSPDVSPPRKSQHRTVSPTPQRARDLSPSRKRRQSSPDLSPPRKRQVASTDLSSPRKGRHDSPPQRNEADRREDRPKRMTDGTLAGLRTGKDLQAEITAKKADDAQRFAALDTSVTGRGAGTVYRDKAGRRVTAEQLKAEADAAAKKRKEEEPPPEWGKGLAQKRAAEDRAKQLEDVRSKPFARTRDDKDLDSMLKSRSRWGDPMAHLVKSKGPSEADLVGQLDMEELKAQGFIVPQEVPPHSWLKRGLAPAYNRFGIRPGKHWDGVDRSTGFEKAMVKAKNAKQARANEAYLWSVADM